MHTAFTYNHYLLKRQVLAFTGIFRIYDESEQLVLYSRQKMFKLREDIRAYSDESQSQELLYIQARNIIDFSAAYDVYDSQMGEHVGTLRRRGFHSMIQDIWEVLDPSGFPIGVLQEDSIGRALARRLLLGALLPQDYDLLVGDQRAADLRQRFSLFRYQLDIDFSEDPHHRLDRRLGLAAGILLAAIEGRQHKD